MKVYRSKTRCRVLKKMKMLNQASFLVGISLVTGAFRLPAQQFPQFQVFGGGSYFRVHASGAEAAEVVGLGVSDFELPDRNLNFGLYGWQAAVTENTNRWFGADADFSGQYGTPKAPFLCSAATPSVALSCLTNKPVLAPVTTRLHTFTFGPRITLRRSERFVPFIHVLIGAAHISGQVNHSAIFLPIPTEVPQGFSKSDTSFTVVPGGGIDIVLNDRVAIRAIEVDYFMTRFYGQRQDNARASAGIVFQFGGK